MQDNQVVTSEAFFRKINDEQRKAVLQAARDMEDAMRAKVIADDKEILAKVQAKGVKINEVDKDAFRKTLEGMETEFPHVKKWVERIKTIA